MIEAYQEIGGGGGFWQNDDDGMGVEGRPTLTPGAGTEAAAGGGVDAGWPGAAKGQQEIDGGAAAKIMAVQRKK